MGELKEELDSKVTLDNLCSPEIVELSQKLDKFVVTAQHKEVAVLMQKYSEDHGISYEKGFEIAKEKLLSDRAATPNSDNNHSKKS